MAGFTFQFQSVLEHRRRVEDQHQRDLAQILRQKLILETQLTTLQQRITDDKSAMADSLVGHVDVRRIRQHANHSMQVTGRAQQLAVRLLAIHRQVEHARGKLLEATRARKASELLRDKHYQRWQRDQQRRETAELDDIATQAYTRRLIRNAS